jgi:hypothetical protein
MRVLPEEMLANSPKPRSVVFRGLLPMDFRNVNQFSRLRTRGMAFDRTQPLGLMLRENP